MYIIKLITNLEGALSFDVSWQLSRATGFILVRSMARVFNLNPFLL